jgi:hypothetical protein
MGDSSRVFDDIRIRQHASEAIVLRTRVGKESTTRHMLRSLLCYALLLREGFWQLGLYPGFF